MKQQIIIYGGTRENPKKENNGDKKAENIEEQWYEIYDKGKRINKEKKMKVKNMIERKKASR